MDAPYCDRCGESLATIKFQETGSCDDCAADLLRPGISESLGYRPCARVLHLPDCAVICLVPYGTEHDHQA